MYKFYEFQVRGRPLWASNLDCSQLNEEGLRQAGSLHFWLCCQILLVSVPQNQKPLCDMHDLGDCAVGVWICVPAVIFCGMATVTLWHPLCRVFCGTGHPLRQAHAVMGKVRDTQRPVHLLDPNPDPSCEQVRDCHWGRVESSPPSRGRSLLRMGWARSCTQRHLWCPGSWLPFKLESKYSPAVLEKHFSF